MAEIKVRKKKNGQPSYTVCVKIKGAEPQYKTFARKTDAQEWANSIETKIRENINFPKRALQRITVENLIDKYIEYELPKKKQRAQTDMKRALNWYKKEIGHLYLSSVNSAVLVECRNKLATKKKEIPMVNGVLNVKDEVISPATVNHYMAYMQIVFTYAVNELEVMQTNPMSKVKKLTLNNKRTRCLELKEITKLLNACKDVSYELFLCVMIALLADARKGEIIKLTWKDVDLEHKMFYFKDRKNKEDIGIPIHELLYQELLEYKKAKPVRYLDKDYLFPDENGNPKESLIGKLFPKIVKKCGIKDFRFHDLRHTGASWQAMNGVSQAFTQRILGHKTSAMTNRYSHLRDEGLRPVINDIGDIMLSDWLKVRT